MRTRKSKKAKRATRDLCPPAEGCGPEAGRVKRQIDARDAVAHLRLIQHGGHIVELHREFFPEDFATEGIDYSSAERLLESYDRFAWLVDANLFPVHTFSDNPLFYEELDGVLITMNLCLHQFRPLVWHYRAMDLSPVERSIVSAADGKGFDGFPMADMRPPEGHYFSHDTLHKVSCKQKGIVSRLWLASMALLGCTGNLWLDLGEEDYYEGEPPEWSEGAIRFYASEWKEANRVSEQVNEFFYWANGTGEDSRVKAKRLERIKRLLRRAWVPNKSDIMQTRILIPAGRPLIETLAEGTAVIL
jgi:hypothetical protein